jgi:hypothetical protein
MADYPNLSTGKIARYPLVRTVSYRTRVLTFLNGAQQRWSVRKPLLSPLILTYTNIKRADRTTLENFFKSMKGAFDHTFTLTLDGTAYLNCYFDQDEMVWTEQKPNRWSTTVKIRQSLNG